VSGPAKQRLQASLSPAQPSILRLYIAQISSASEETGEEAGHWTKGARKKCHYFVLEVRDKLPVPVLARLTVRLFYLLV